MSIIISGIKLNITDDDALAIDKAISKLGNIKYTYAGIYKKSIDARRGNISKVISVLVDSDINEETLVENIDDISVRIKTQAIYPSITGTEQIQNRPIIIGFGPAGMFAALILARNGYNPIIFERGASVDDRDISVDKFFKSGTFDVNTNIQFGEGGAGTYSDGKLTTRINDPLCEIVLEELLKYGAPADAIKLAKPHIGTDILKNIVKNIRKEIISLGGEVFFNHKFETANIKSGVLKSITVNNSEIPATIVILATGHSARDTFENINDIGIYIEPKAFSVGARIEHLQADIDKSMYGKFYGMYDLPPAEYSLAHKNDDRACYSFCMCPGGMVVPAISEENAVLTNGMSYHARDMINANSAIVCSVNPSDFSGNSPLAGMYFQREIEKRAFNGDYKAPMQKVGDFLEDKLTSDCSGVMPSYPIGTYFGKMSNILPEFVTRQMKIGINMFSKKVSAFGSADAILTGPETRTSSPIRIKRGEDFFSINTYGIIPCGEGAGYAGGIMSAAVDGIKVAAAIMSKYKAG